MTINQIQKNNIDNDVLTVNTKVKKIVKNKIKNILLINPPQFQTHKIDLETFKNRRYFNYPPYGLGILRRILIEKKYNVKILDLNFELLQMIEESTKKSKKFQSYIKNFKNKKKLENIPVKDLMIPILDNVLDNFQPEMVGLTCMFTMTHDRMIKLAKRVKKHSKDIIVFAGGVHPTSSAELILKEEKSIDFISLFEGDSSVPDLIDYLNNQNNNISSIRQIGTLVDERYYEIDNRSSPSSNIRPSYGDLKINLYSKYGEIGAYRFWWKNNTVASTILSNRGCRARCSFCSVRNFNGKGVRGRSINSVVDELQFLKEHYGVNHVMWLDDDLLFDRDRTIGMFNEMVKRNLKITWDASNGIIASALKDEVLDAAAQSGCIGMHFGIESGSDRVLRSVHKPSGKKHYLALEHKLKKYPQIFTKGFLMIGFPNETLAEIKETIDMAVQISLDWYTIQVVTPLPKTELHSQLVEIGEITEDKLQPEKLNYGNRTGKIRQRENEEIKKAKDFKNMFSGNLKRIPEKKEMEDIWFMSDYKVNYERLNSLNEYKKLEKIDFFLQFINKKVTQKNPLIDYYRSVVLNKLSKNFEAEKLKKLSEFNLLRSDYWQKRFSTLDININKMN